MKLTIDGALPKLATIVLSALVCVACNSEPEAEIDPESLGEAEVPAEVALSQTAPLEGCTLDFPGAVVDVSSLDVNNSLIGEFGGLCKLSNTVLGRAAELRRLFFKENYCSLVADKMDSSETEFMAAASSVLGRSIEQVQKEQEEAAKIQLAESICADESIMVWAVQEFLKNADLNAYSIGNVTSDGMNCPAVVWSYWDDDQGQVYNVTGLGMCSEIKVPHARLFNPEQNPDGQLPGDYIRQTLGYTGLLPERFDYKDTNYRFLSDEMVMKDEEVQPAPMEADRSILGDSAQRYIYWASGDETVDNMYFSADEALTRQYHVKDHKKMVPRMRALTALQRSYGAPTLEHVAQVDNGAWSGIHATVKTSSGDQFVMRLEPAADMSQSQLMEWLASTRPELLVVKEMDAELNEYLTLEGALFTDGMKTVFARLEDCECEAQGFLGSLDKDQMASHDVTEKLRTDFLARARSTTAIRDWTLSSELGPRAVGYTLSSYRDSSRNGDAVFVALDGGAAHSLYVAMDVACNNQSLLFSFEKRTMNMPAACREIEGSGTAFALLGDYSELMSVMHNGSRMTIGLVEQDSASRLQEYQFSLMGVTQMVNGLNVDEAGYTDAALKGFRGLELDNDAESTLFELLQRRPGLCLSGENEVECVVEEAAPKMAAARPAARARNPIMIDADPVDYTMGYAQVIAEQLGSSNQAACNAVVEQIMEVARSSGTPDSRSRRIDIIVGGAPTKCF